MAQLTLHVPPLHLRQLLRCLPLEEEEGEKEEEEKEEEEEEDQ